MTAGAAIGVSTNHLETKVGMLSTLSTSGSTFLTETGDVTVTTVSLTVNRVDATGETSITTPTDTQEDLVTGHNGDIVLVATGSVTLEKGTLDSRAVSANGFGNILIDAYGSDSDVTLNADIFSDTGHITLKAFDTITIGGEVTITTGTPGTISLDAEGGALTMAGTATVTATGSGLRLHAAGDITVGNLIATNVSILSETGAIINAAGSTKNVTATSLRLQADDAIGAPGNHLTTDVTTLSALSRGTTTAGIYVTESDSVTVDTVSVTVTEFGPTAETSSVVDASQSDLAAGGNGNIVLVAGGTVTLKDGSDVVGLPIEDNTNGLAVRANGTGSVLIDVNNGALNVSSNIFSGTGHITLKASDAMTIGIGVTISTGTPGTISLDAEGGYLTMAGNAWVIATNSSLRMHAAGDITVGNLIAANVSIFSESGSIINALSSTKNVTATRLRLQADGMIGTDYRHLTTDVDFISADSESTLGGIYLTEKNDISVTKVGVSVTELTAIAGTELVTDAGQNGLFTVRNGNIVLVTIDGSITIDDGDESGLAVSANGSGSIVLQANGAGSSIIINADMRSRLGTISILADEDIMQHADILTSGSTVLVKALSGSIVMDQGVQTCNSDGVIEYRSYIDVVLAFLHAASGAVRVYAETGSITGRDELNVCAENALFYANVNIGLRNIQPLSLSVDRIAATAVTGSIHIVNEGTITVTSIDELNGLAAHDGISLESLKGDIVVLAPIDTKKHADALFNFSFGSFEGKSVYFEDAGTYFKARYKELQFLWNNEKQPFMAYASDQMFDVQHNNYALLHQNQMASLSVDDLPAAPDAYAEVMDGYLFFHWSEVPGTDSYLLVVERDKMEFASRWLEDIAWRPFERFPAGIYDWSLYAWATDGLKLVYGPMHFRI